MTLDEMKKKKTDLGYSYEQISERSGVPLGTVQKIFGGITKNPRYETLQALSGAFVSEESISVSYKRYHPVDGFTKGISDSLLKESAAEYVCGSSSDQEKCQKKQGEYTIEDYYALPDERRVELINGVFYDMAAPDTVHQAISVYISNIFFNHIRENHGTCRVFCAPLDVQLNKDDKTVVQPDILVLCTKEKDRKKLIFGAPDLVIEILSDSTRGRDLVLKLNKYCEAGVREYWAVDPRNRAVTVFTFQEEIEAVTYDACACVPVGIWGGRCVIDLAELFDYAGLTE